MFKENQYNQYNCVYSLELYVKYSCLNLTRDLKYIYVKNKNSKNKKKLNLCVHSKKTSLLLRYLLINPRHTEKTVWLRELRKWLAPTNRHGSIWHKHGLLHRSGHHRDIIDRGN